jgi:hypothetical protein
MDHAITGSPAETSIRAQYLVAACRVICATPAGIQIARSGGAIQFPSAAVVVSVPRTA